MDILTKKLDSNRKGYYFYQHSNNSNGCFLNLDKYQEDFPCLIRRNSIFTTIFFENEIEYPEQGWKIHISTDIYNSQKILAIVSSYLGSKKVMFKFITNISCLLQTTRKDFPRMQFGKFITIYTGSAKETKIIGQDLTQLLKEFEGIKILTDRNFPNSNIVFYRYGVIVPKWKINNENDHVYTIKDGNNNNISDSRKGFFYLPPGIHDIFPANKKKSPSLNQLFPNFKIVEVIRNNNEGINLIGEIGTNKKTKVILKEGRHLSTLINEQSKIDGFYFKKNEAKILKEFAECKFIPKFINSKIIDKNYYLIESRMPGISLKKFGPTNPILKSNHTKAEIKEYLKDCLTISSSLITILLFFLNHNKIISDISPDNFVFDLDKKELSIVDLESVQNIGETNIPLLRTDGFFNPKTKLGTVESDISGIGLTIFYLFFSKSIEVVTRPEDIIIDINYIKNIFMQKDLEHFFEILQLMIFSPEKINLENVLSNIKHLQKNFIHDNTLKINLCPQIEKTKLKEKVPNIFEELVNQSKNQCKKNLHFVERRLTPYYDNKFSYSYGLAGIENILKNITHENRYVDMFYKEFAKFKYNDKLSMTFSGGLSGVLYSLPLSSNLNKQITNDLIKYIIQFKNRNFGLFDGYSGVGLSLINNSKKSQKVENALSFLVTKLLNEKALVNYDYLGLAQGGAGIAYFLLRYEQHLKSHKYDNIIYKWLLHDFDLAIRDNDNKFVGLPSKRNSTIAYPYLVYGTAGLLRVFLEIYDYCPNLQSKLKNKIKEMAASLDLPYTAYYGYFFGIAGIIDTLIEFDNRFPSDKTQSVINRLLSYLILHKFKSESGHILLLSDQLQAVGTDLGSGITGILKVLGKYCNKLEYDSFWRIKN
ncbi:hypothetical protein GYM68_09140 [Lactobacillus panisapium]|uniref:class III lanthionine synthetase LanKC N-terminal domain-containing protein n=1 Tax=Lactobacillus panisapium TaxID=2012495 RepID=UPI001C69F1F3|nr:lanthionine synthetase LanC family protein [Lactobacillus panisapium]QYN59391.1 hypothetical protein GYM68_09140 [Lactobacillus panisapium]